MFNFPFFGYPYRRPYYEYYNKLNNYNIVNEKQKIQRETLSLDKNISENYSHFEKDPTTVSTHIFEILGIKLFLDDLIIIAILFFLYQEKVSDEMLYIILFLLLFS